MDLPCIKKKVPWSHDLKTFEYEFHTPTQKSSNQNTLFIRYSVLIGCTKIIQVSSHTLKLFNRRLQTLLHTPSRIATGTRVLI